MSDEAQFATALSGDAGASLRDDAILGWMQVAPFGVVITDADLRVRGWNRWLAERSGVSEGMALGRFLFDLFPDIPARRLDAPFRRALLGEVAVLSTALHGYLLPLPPPSREFGVAHMRQTARIAPLHAGGAIVGTITVLEDVTQREFQAHILRRQQEHDRVLSEALALLLRSDHPLDSVAQLFPRIAIPLKLDVFFSFLMSPDGNQMQLHAIAGVAPEVRKAMASIPLEGPLPCSLCARLREPLIISQVQSSKAPHAKAPQRLGLRSYAAFPLLIGDHLLGVFSVGSYARDFMAAEEITFLRTLSQYLAITIDRAQREQALREAQATLTRHADTLEMKVAERTVRLRETIEELEGFSYTVAHDLRAPIRWLSGYAELLLTDYHDAMPPEARALVSRLQHAGLRLDALTRDLLSFSKVTRHDVTLAPVAVAEVVGELVSFTPELQGGVVTFAGPDASVLAQRTLLQQCLSNLFDNALKFARPGVPTRIVVRMEHRREAEVRKGGMVNPLLPLSPPTTSASRAAQPVAPPGPWMRLWVEDDGIGIAPEVQGRIFGIFERAKGVEHIEGTGIGLAIVARAVQRMGGACGVVSELGRGSRFWIDLAPAE